MRIDDPAVRSLSDAPFYYFCDFNFAHGQKGLDGVPDLIEKKGYLVNVYRGKRDSNGYVTYRKTDGDSFDYSNSAEHVDFNSRIDVNYDGKLDLSRFWDDTDQSGGISTYLLSKLKDQSALNSEGKIPQQTESDVNGDGIIDVVIAEKDAANVWHHFAMTTMWHRPVENLFDPEPPAPKK